MLDQRVPGASGSFTSLTKTPPVEWATKTIGLARVPNAARVLASSTNSSPACAKMSPWKRPNL
jgi:hypothetical protein